MKDGLTKKKLITIMNKFRHLAESYKDQHCYNAGYGYGYADALRCIIRDYEIIYQSARMKHAITDATDHLNDYFENDNRYEKVIKSGIPEIVAERFIENHDCNVAENDQYESIIEDVLRMEGWIQ